MASSTLMLGSPRDPTLRHTIAAFRQKGLTIDILNLDRFCETGGIEGHLNDPRSIVLREADREWHFAHVLNCYARFVELPSSWSAETSAPAWSRHRALQLAVNALSQVALVVNRPSAGGSNDSKPYQTALLQRHGFLVPRSCSTNLPRLAERFVASCERGAIYKSNSGERSIVQAVSSEDKTRFEFLPRCPVFFQERIWGANVRVHVVRDRCHAVLIRSDAVDYRYDDSGKASEMPFTLPGDIAALCVSVTAALDLEFSGIDFILTEDSQYYCLEVNPMPGYHGYDRCLRLAISDDLAALFGK